MGYTHTHTHMSTPPETDEMPRGDWCCMKPPWSVSMTHTVPPTLPCPPVPSLHQSLLCFSITKRKCAWAVQWPTFFWFGGAICPAAAVSGPLVLRVPPYPHSFPFNAYTHTRMHIPSCFRGRLRPLQTHKHTHTRALPPYPLVSLRPNLSTSPPGSLAPWILY